MSMSPSSATSPTAAATATSDANSANGTARPPPNAPGSATTATNPARAPATCTPSSTTTAIGVLQRAVTWFADHGVTVERVLSDNGAAYKSHAWRDTCTNLGITPKKTRPYRPQTNGKIERFHRTLADGWAYARFYTTETQRQAALPGWLHFYNHHRPHSAIGGQPPITRLTNLPGHHT
jgi:transposase InsO family protein